MSDLPLSTLLSQVLVAYTIEFDNEFESRMPHRTSRGPAGDASRGPWLVSMAMWSNFMRYLDADGAPLRDVEDLVAMTNLGGMQRWGYVTVTPDPADGRAKPPRRDLVVRPTPAGRQAQQVWAPLAGEIEQRWRDRFGAGVDRLRQSLSALTSDGLPQYLPVVNYSNGMRTLVPLTKREAEPDLAALLSQVLLTFTLDFERESALSLPIVANVMRLLDNSGVPVRDLVVRSGVSKEAIAASVGFLERRGYVVRTGRQVLLTPEGQQARDKDRQLLGRIEQQWQGTDDLRAALEPLAGQPVPPSPGGWRATIGKPATLPHHPMVLHRGGFPDGS
jgi:DNA-binding MarR family transcriptional regulator